MFDQEGKSKILKDTFFEGGHITQEQFDEDFKKEIENRLPEIKNTLKNTGDNFLNQPISFDEVEASIQRLKKDKAPVPDQLYSNLLIKSNDSLKMP